MGRLLGHTKLKVEDRKQQKKKQEYKFIGNVVRKRGQFLFALDPETLEVYPVKIETKKHFDVSKKKEIGSHRAVVNPNHSILWAINIKNAKRKFNKL